MAVETLRCRVCESEYPAVASGVCVRCFGPLEPVYDWDEVAQNATREAIQSGPRSLWRYAPLLPTAAPVDAASGPGWTPLVRAPRLAEAVGVGEVYLKLDHTNPTHSFKDRVVAVAAAKAQELGTGVLACASTGNLGNAVAARASASGMRSVVLYPNTVEPEKLLATAVYGGDMYAVEGSYDDCSRLVIELAGELDWAFVNVNLRAYYAEGSKTLAFEIAEQLGWRTPDAVVAPIASGSLFTKIWQGFEQFNRLGLIEGDSPRLYGGQALGCSPVATAFAEDHPVSPVRPNTVAHSLAIGAPADGDLAVATARASGGSIHAVPEDEVGENMSFLAQHSGVFGESAAGVTVGALRAAAESGELGPDDRVVVLVTGTGLKTPQLVDVAAGVPIAADVDELLSELGVEV
ncbi:MAG TPA: threonine synthase [Gaiellaceae bacterium]|jgi:threonine synthase|nr:threonine synthase [Gaiellaceae bacterium]